MRSLLTSFERLRHRVLKSTESFFEAEQALGTRFLVAVAAAAVGLGVMFVTSDLTGTYFSSITITTTIFVTLYSGFVLGIAIAVCLALLADYFFLAPLRSVLDSEQSVEHFIIVVTLALFVSVLIATLRHTMRKVIAAGREAERAHASMDKILSMVSHDIRNSLQASILAVDSMQRAYDRPERLRSLIATALTSLDRTDKMIETLLDTRRARVGNSRSVALDDCDLCEVVQKAYEQLRFVHGEQFRFEKPEPIRGLWNAEGIHRAVENLGTNAVKYGFKNRPITIALRRQNDTVSLSVHNHGNAIDPAEQARLFDRFFRAESAQRDRIKGWGLGLSVVKDVAEAHGGTVTVRSQPEDGTTFTITAPVRLRRPADGDSAA